MSWKKRRRKKKRSPAGYRLNGTRVYHAKGKTKTRKKTYKTKKAALRALKHKRKR